MEKFYNIELFGGCVCVNDVCFDESDTVYFYSPVLEDVKLICKELLVGFKTFTVFHGRTYYYGSFTKRDLELTGVYNRINKIKFISLQMGLFDKRMPIKL